MTFAAKASDCFGLVHPAVDAHTLGVSSIQQLLEDCGRRVVVGGADVCRAAGSPQDPAGMAALREWIAANRISVLGFSYRLDPKDGVGTFLRFLHRLKDSRLLAEGGGPLRAVFFAGLPETCRVVREQVPEVAGVFRGDESPAETLRLLGIPPTEIPANLGKELAYDETRLAFGRDLVRKGEYLAVKPANPRAYPAFGTARDGLELRILDSARRGAGPLMRAHVGPYLSDRAEAVRRFLDWARRLAAGGFLDVLSVGTSQLSQSDFGEDWGDRPNGGGVPLNSPEEFAAVWQAARPMLVRTYAGTKNIPALARMYEETIHIAWHALSLWWFCLIDGRGPYTVRENLRQHVETMKCIASTGKPLEANVPHHFAFRGADDVTYAVSAYLAARTARTCGIRCFVLQNMLNTPKGTWGIQDLAKARATLRLVREMEREDFRVVLQPRGGLDYFSPDLERAKAQLAAVSALMDDIEPTDPASPPVIHVVSYSEASHLADPAVVEESIQITRHAVSEYRRLRAAGQVDDMASDPEVDRRAEELLAEARTVIRAIETAISRPYTAAGLYRALEGGFLPVPYLWECRQEFAKATRWQTRLVRGSVRVVDGQGVPVPAERRMRELLSSL